MYVLICTEHEKKEACEITAADKHESSGEQLSVFDVFIPYAKISEFFLCTSINVYNYDVVDLKF